MAARYGGELAGMRHQLGENAGGSGMSYRPPKGVAPPQLEGKRTGRPKGSRNHALAWADPLWAYHHRDDERVDPPNPNALLWWHFANRYPNELEDFLDANGLLGRPRRHRRDD